jgi:formylglycine-generating enzyme required for sulfatase activity/HEAT repeat protein
MFAVHRPLVTVALAFLGAAQCLPLAIARDDTDPISEGQPLSFWVKDLKSKDPATRKVALRAVGALGPKAKSAVGPVTKLLADSQPGVIERAAQTLVQIGPDAKDATGALVQLVSYPDSGVRKAAVEAITRISPVTKEAVPDLIKIVQDRENEHRWWALEVLDRMGTEAKDAEAALTELAGGDRDVAVRRTAAEMVIRINPKSAVPVLTQLLRDEDVPLRSWAVKALGDNGPEGKASLAKLVREDRDYAVRRAAAEIIMRIDPKGAVPFLTPLVREEDRMIRVETKELAALKGATGPVTFSPDGKLLATSSADGIKLWDTATWKEQAALGKGSLPGVFSRDGKLLATSSDRGVGEVKVWDVGTGKERVTLAVTNAENILFLPLVFSADGKALATVSLNLVGWTVGKPSTEVKLWDLTSGKERVVPERKEVIGETTVIVRLGGLASATFFADVQVLCRDTKIDPCDIAEGRVRAILSVEHENVVTTHGSTLASVVGTSVRTGWGFGVVDLGRRVRLFDKGRRKEFILEGHQAGVHGLAFSGGGKVLASADGSGTVILWDVLSGRKLGTIDARPKGPNNLFGNCIAFGPDDKTLVLGGPSQEIRAWNVTVVDLLNDLDLGKGGADLGKEEPKRPGKTETVDLGGGVRMEFVRIPSGTFQMGSPLSEKGRNPFERDADVEKQHPVEITGDFYLGKYTVTRGQFGAFVQTTGYKTEAEEGAGGYGWNLNRNSSEPGKEYNWRNPGFNQTDEHPVVNVSWNDANEFCKWAGKKAGRKIRLPTEAEWEYACRAGSQKRYFFGDDEEDLARYANGADVSFRKATGNKYGIKADDGYAFTAPVGKFRANGFGLFDMHGNVGQWCQDWYDKEYYGKSPKSDPQGPNTDNGTYRVARGGDWGSEALSHRAAVRSGVPPYASSCGLGFRVAFRPD